MASSRRRRNEAPAEDVDDIWKIAAKNKIGSESGDITEGSSASATSAASSQGGQASETFSLFVGQKQAGKTSLVTAFHNPAKDDVPKPTVGLEYIFARRNAGTNQPKDIANIWELGGGARLASLVSVPITPQTIATSVIIVVVDLSQPNNVVPALKLWFDLIRKRVDECLHVVRSSNLAASEALMTAASARYLSQGNGKPHPDVDVVTPIYCPIIVVANKLDTLKDREPMERKVVSQALRFMCHQAGASLLSCGFKDKTSLSNYRSMMTSHLFASASSSSSSSINKKKEVNADKPMVIPAGSDSFEDILRSLPKGSDRSDFIGPRGISIDAIDIWTQLVGQYFGSPSLTEEDTIHKEDEIDTAANSSSNQKSGEYAEPSIDEARSQRDTMLEQYRKEAERKRRVGLQAASGSKTRQTDKKSTGGSSSKSRAEEKET